MNSIYLLFLFPIYLPASYITDVASSLGWKLFLLCLYTVLITMGYLTKAPRHNSSGKKYFSLSTLPLK